MEENSHFLERKKLLIISFLFSAACNAVRRFFLLRKGEKFEKTWVGILLPLSLCIGGSYVPLSSVF